MNESGLIYNTLNLGSKSFLAVAAINLIIELKSIRYDKETKKYVIGTEQTIREKLKNIFKQFVFIFGQLFCFNFLIKLNSKRLILPLGALIGYLFSETCDISLPLLVSAYILAKIVGIFIEKGAQLGIIKNEYLIYKLLFIFCAGSMNVCIFAFPSLMPKRVYKSYMKIGRLTEVDRLQFGLFAGKHSPENQQ